MYKCCHIKHPYIMCALMLTILTVLFGVTRNEAFSSAEEEAVELPVIMYHSICDKAPSDYSVTPEQVESDMRWLKEKGYTAVSAEQVIAYTENRGQLPEKPVMITADDGFYNNLSQLVPLLEKYDMCAVISIVGSFTDVYAENDPHNDMYSYLTWDDINTMLASGRIELGNHTYDMHSVDGNRKGCKKLENETEEEYRQNLSADIMRLQEEIKEHTGISPVVFTYPFGAVSKGSLPVLRENGFLMTLTCREAPNYIIRDPQCLYGIFRYNRSGLYSTEKFMNMMGII